jgi:peptide/nickel transport system substrate-binding protein
MARFFLLALIGAALLGGCRQNGAHGRIDASVIGTPGASSTRLASPDALTRAVTESGLVRLDREGQVIPGAAARWAILDNGLDYIFRIDDTNGLTAGTAARRLRRAIASDRHDPRHALFAPVERIQAVTGTVVEIRLSAPQSDLLTLLALPQLGISANGTMRVAKQKPGEALLRPSPGEVPLPAPVLLRTEPVGRAVVRFVSGDSALVLGGTFNDLPVALAGKPRRGTLRFDPATGLFGFATRDLADSQLREALSIAIDRDRIVAAIGATGLAKATTIAGSTIEPPLEQRRATARTLLTGHDVPMLRVAMLQGPGAHLLFALVAQDWRRIGVTATAVPMNAPADLALVDMVAPPGSLAALACSVSKPCDPSDRLQLIAPPFIPIAAPVRWSLVARGIDRFTENGLAAHPLDQLRSP